jgi:hypothetical protein
MNDEDFVAEDNLEMAMTDVAESIKPTRKPKTGASEGDTAPKQVLLRATELDHMRWKAAAEKRGVSMAEFIRDSVNLAVKDVLDCPHPSNMKRFYPWATNCLQCGEKWIHDKKKPRAERGG